jgi:hypothetical protein
MKRRSAALVPSSLRIEDAAFLHAGDGLADQRAGVLGQRQVAVRAAEDHDVEAGRRLAVGASRRPHHTPSGSGMMQRLAPAQQPLDAGAGVVGLAAAGGAEIAEPIIWKPRMRE